MCAGSALSAINYSCSALEDAKSITWSLKALIKVGSPRLGHIKLAAVREAGERSENRSACDLEPSAALRMEAAGALKSFFCFRFRVRRGARGIKTSIRTRNSRAQLEPETGSATIGQAGSSVNLFRVQFCVSLRHKTFLEKPRGAQKARKDKQAEEKVFVLQR